MNEIREALLKSAQQLETDRDIYSGLILQQAPLTPDNIVIFTRTRLRAQDYAGAVHHRYVLCIFLENPGTVFIQRHRFSAQEGQTVLIRPFEQHYYALPPDHIEWIFITFELPAEQSFALKHQCSVLTDPALGILQNLLQAYLAAEETSCSLLLALLLHELNQHQDLPVSLPADAGQKLAERINSYIHDHLKKRFTIDDISRHCGISPSHLRMTFRKTMGISLGTYIQRIRFDRACYLLQTTRLTVSEIAYQCGFTSPAVFCRAFNNQAGCSPNVFRQETNRHQP